MLQIPNFLPRLGLFLAVLLTTAACGSGRPGNGPPNPHRILTGSLEENALAIVDSEWAESCDHVNRTAMLEVTRLLDEKMDDIRRFATTENPTANSAESGDIVLGPLHLYREEKPSIITPGWQFDLKPTWESLAQVAHSLRDTPMSQKWVSLLRQTRSRLTDDRHRIEYYTLWVLPEDEQDITLLIQELESQQDGDPIQLSPERIRFVNSRYGYSEIFHFIESESSASARKLRVERFLKRLRNDLSSFTLVPATQSTSSMEDEKLVITVPLAVSSDLAPFTDTLAKHLLEEWVSSNIEVRIHWSGIETSAFGSTFEIRFLNEFGARSFVSFENRAMNLADGSTNRTLTHEFGHVLGFGDHYFTIWEADRCAFKDAYREDDIMSEHSGSVLPEDWARLKKAFTSSP